MSYTTTTTSSSSSNNNSYNTTTTPRKQQFACLYTKRKTQKQKRWNDGRLVLTGNRAVLHDADPPPGSGDPQLDGCDLTVNERETILQTSVGQMLETEKFLIEVVGPWLSTASRPAVVPTPISTKAVSSSMQKLLTSKFQKPKPYIPPHPNSQPDRLVTVLGKRRRPLQPGELVATHYQHQNGFVPPTMHQHGGEGRGLLPQPPPQHHHEGYIEPQGQQSTRLEGSYDISPSPNSHLNDSSQLGRLDGEQQIPFPSVPPPPAWHPPNEEQPLIAREGAIDRTSRRKQPSTTTTLDFVDGASAMHGQPRRSRNVLHQTGVVSFPPVMTDHPNCSHENNNRASSAPRPGPVLRDGMNFGSIGIGNQRKRTAETFAQNEFNASSFYGMDDDDDDDDDDGNGDKGEGRGQAEPDGFSTNHLFARETENGKNEQSESNEHLRPNQQPRNLEVPSGRVALDGSPGQCHREQTVRSVVGDHYGEGPIENGDGEKGPDSFRLEQPHPTDPPRGVGSNTVSRLQLLALFGAAPDSPPTNLGSATTVGTKVQMNERDSTSPTNSCRLPSFPEPTLPTHDSVDANKVDTSGHQPHFLAPAKENVSGTVSNSATPEPINNSNSCRDESVENQLSPIPNGADVPNLGFYLAPASSSSSSEGEDDSHDEDETT